MSIKKPNHICKNPSCKRKYYACDYCDRTQRWESVACSWDCWLKYQDAVIEARSKNKKISLMPERTDMTNEEVQELMKKPVKEVLEDTKEQLKDYISDDTPDFSSAVKKVNDEIDKKKVASARIRKRKLSEDESK